MSELQTEQAIIEAIITVTRAATGAVETYKLYGTPVAETTEQEQEENGSHA